MGIWGSFHEDDMTSRWTYRSFVRYKDRKHAYPGTLGESFVVLHSRAYEKLVACFFVQRVLRLLNQVCFAHWGSEWANREWYDRTPAPHPQDTFRRLVQG
jgi:hypothetical protein